MLGTPTPQHPWLTRRLGGGRQGGELPLLLWRESSAQHFSGPRGGNYDPSRPDWTGVDTPCVSVPRATAMAANWRNAFTVSDRPAPPSDAATSC